jgi:hypothetical protein
LLEFGIYIPVGKETAMNTISVIHRIYCPHSDMVLGI